MQKIIQFEKYQGLGNDFVLFDRFHHPEIPEPPAEVITRICDRRYGAGADGILLFNVESNKTPENVPLEIRMTYYNADGSRAETCFNGIRCIALHAVLSKIAMRENTMRVITDAGTADLNVLKNDNMINMKIKQTVEFEPSKIPVVGDKKIIDNPIKIDDYELTATALSLGNPHLIAWNDYDNLDELNLKIVEIGPEVQHSGLFPVGTNFELAHLIDEDKILMAVWERGVGKTLACGSGATAVVCAGVASGRLKPAKQIQVIMAGGTLIISAPNPEYSDTDPITIIGPAEHVYSGYLDEQIWSIC
ncbi:diaminopimelate epimerase [bacterium]|nr:diaminopimelate epimerase [bacterium]